MIPVVFDLDGTLLDSAPDIHAAVNRMLADQGQAPLALPKVISFIGNGLPHLVGLVIAEVGMSMDDHKALTASVLAHYDAVNGAMTKPYAGVVDALEALKAAGHPMAICTNKPEAPARHILDDTGLMRFFDAVVGGDSLPQRKPDPAMLHAALTGLGATRGLYVGDSEVDAETAARADMPFLLFTEGYRKGPVGAMPHHAAFDAFAALPGLVRTVAVAA